MPRKYKRAIEQNAIPTAGDWTEPRIYRDPDDRPRAVTVYGGQPLRAIFTIPNPDPEALANARLLSRASEFLRVATVALAQMETMSGHVEEHLAEGCDYWSAMGALRRVIEQATGRS